MLNIYDYASPRAETLPKDFVNDLLKELTDQQNKLVTAKIMVSKIKNSERKAQREDFLKQKESELRGAINLLDAVGLHAAYNWLGNKEKYIFPSESDCAMQEDWFYQCED